MIYFLFLCLIIIGILAYELAKKQKLDKTEKYVLEKQIKEERDKLDMYKGELCDAIVQYNTYKKDASYEEQKMNACKRQLEAARKEYEEIVGRKTDEINEIIEDQRQRRQQQLDESFHEKQAYYDALLEDTKRQCAIQDEAIKNASQEKWNEAMALIQQYESAIEDKKEKFESIEKTLRMYDAEKQEKLFYTIQLPDEYKEDIDFLLTTVAAKVQHPDIISKLVWAEYVKPNLDNTFKRIEIRPEPGIYKLTNIETGKAYIGKSTNVKTRIADHFKSSIGIQSIADQAVHHAIRKEGFWNWSIEVIVYCEKDKLSELEKFYIETFDTQNFGYNKTGGG